MLVATLGVLELLARQLLRGAVLATIPAASVREHVTGATDLVYDPVLGWKRSILPNPTLGLDSHGFRHPEVREDKAAGVVRGFVLGDSQTYGAGVNAGEDYPSVAERLLREKGLPVEVINAGISGYRSHQVLRLIETQLLAFEPDFLVVDCQTGDARREVRPPYGGGARELAERIAFQSRLYRGLRLLVDRTSDAPRMGESPPAIPRDGRPRTRAEDAAEKGNHVLIMELAEAEGIAVFFVDYPFQEQPARPLAPAELLPPGARVVPATAALRRTGLPASALFLDNNHLTGEGNAQVGAALAATLEPFVREAGR